MMDNKLSIMLKKYEINNLNDYTNAIKEIMQLIILTGLAKGGFFNNAIFYGGTSLRILRGLDRFSEDLDFILIDSKEEFNIKKYLTYAINELLSMRIDAHYNIKEKIAESSVIIYIKTNLKQLINLTNHQFLVNKEENINIKLDIETNSIAGGVEEYMLITSPSFSKIRTYDMPTLFAIKLMAIIGRNWKNRVKGRDYYDYLFYVSNDIPINMNFLNNGLLKFKAIDNPVSFVEFKELLNNKFKNANFTLIKDDILPFIKNVDDLNQVNKDIFLHTVDVLKCI